MTFDLRHCSQLCNWHHFTTLQQEFLACNIHIMNLLYACICVCFKGAKGVPGTKGEQGQQGSMGHRGESGLVVAARFMKKGNNITYIYI